MIANDHYNLLINYMNYSKDILYSINNNFNLNISTLLNSYQSLFDIYKNNHLIFSCLLNSVLLNNKQLVKEDQIT